MEPVKTFLVLRRFFVRISSTSDILFANVVESKVKYGLFQAARVLNLVTLMVLKDEIHFGERKIGGENRIVFI